MNNINILIKKLINSGKRVNTYVLSMVIAYNIVIPAPIADLTKLLQDFKINREENNVTQELEKKVNNLEYPVIDLRSPKYTKKVKLTAYSSSYAECDATPFTTASGTTVKKGIVAANCLPFGTRIRIPGIYGDQIFVVEDRLAARMGCSTIDVWHSNRAEAINFGVQYSEIEVL